MATSGARDRQALWDAAREIYAQRSLARFGHTALAALARVVDYEYGALHLLDMRRGAIGPTIQAPEDRVAQRDVPRFVHHLRDHPLLAHYARCPTSGPRKISDCLTQRQFHRTGLYAECYRALGAEYQISFLLPLPPSSGFTHTVALNRRRPDFCERDRQVLDLLRPHLALAYRNAQAFDRLRRRALQLERALDECDRGVVVLDARGRMRMRTERARTLTEKYYGTSRAPDRLPDTLADWTRSWLSELDRHEGTRLPSGPVVIQRGTERLVVRVLPDWANAEHLLLMDEQRADVPTDRLAERGLSRREAEVLSWVARGKTNAEVASILAISPRTVQKHLEHVFEKLGVETRTAAAAAALRTRCQTATG